MKKDTHNFIASCNTFQWQKGEIVKSSGALQPFLIPNHTWIDIYMDFIMGIPKAWNKTIIMVVVDIMTKYAHFCALRATFTPSLVAQVFIDQIFKLHGMPTSSLSSRDPNFTNKFW